MTAPAARIARWTCLGLSLGAGAGAAGSGLFAAGLWTTTIALALSLLGLLWPTLLATALAAAGLGLAVTTAIFSLAPVAIPAAALTPLASLAAAGIALGLVTPTGIGPGRIVGLVLLAGLAHLVAMHALAVALHGPGASYFSSRPALALAVPGAWMVAGGAIAARCVRNRKTGVSERDPSEKSGSG